MTRLGVLAVITVVLGDPLWEFLIYETKNVYASNKNNCTAIDMELARVDSEERWLDAKRIITRNNRHWPDYDVYIGLTYNITTKKFYWEDGTEATYTKWFTNEPFNVDTRRCVALARDAELQFRTYACDYFLYYSCSKQVIISTTTEEQEVVTTSSKKGGPENIIIGLTVGFGIFLAISGLCCLICWCCWSSSKSPKKVYLPPRMPTKQTRLKSADKDPVLESSKKQHSFYDNHGITDDIDEDLPKSSKNSSACLSSPSPSTSSGINSRNDSSGSGKEVTGGNFHDFHVTT